MMRWLILLAMLPLVASASGDCNGHSCNDSGSDIVVDAGSSVSNSVRDTSRAIGLGAGDVDIAQCYRSWSLIVYQDSKPNLLCVADSLDAKGMYDAAARARCSVRAYARIFDSVDECITLSTAAPVVQSVAMPESIDDDDEDHRELEIRLAKLEADRQAEASRARAATRAAQQATAEIEAKQQADRDYAQQTIEELKQWK